MEKTTRIIRSESQEAPQTDYEEQRHLLTLEALAEIDAGEGVEHASVKAWAESLLKKEH